MRDDAARALRVDDYAPRADDYALWADDYPGADDYAYLRSRASAHLRAVESPEPVTAGRSSPQARAWSDAARPARDYETRPRGRFERSVPRRDAQQAAAPAVSAPEPARSRPVSVPAPRVTAPRAYGSRSGPAPSDYVTPYGATPGRRTIQITGQAIAPRRRELTTGIERIAARPDRTAMWAVMLGLFLVLVAVATAHASPPAGQHALGGPHGSPAALTAGTPR